MSLFLCYTVECLHPQTLSSRWHENPKLLFQCLTSWNESPRQSSQEQSEKFTANKAKQSSCLIISIQVSPHSFLVFYVIFFHTFVGTICMLECKYYERSNCKALCISFRLKVLFQVTQSYIRRWTWKNVQCSLCRCVRGDCRSLLIQHLIESAQRSPQAAVHWKSYKNNQKVESTPHWHDVNENWTILVF